MALDGTDHSQPIQLAQSLAMSGDLTDSTRMDLIDMLHELAARRRVAPWPGNGAPQSHDLT
ncbi:MAG: hypothetical protein AAGF73_14395 [Actinomycetota bacterium]